MPTISAWDQSVFLFINHLPHTAFSDSLARLLSGIGQWGAVWFLIAIVLFIREEERDHMFFLPFVTAGGIGVVLSEFVLKYIVARPRPEFIQGAIVLATPGNFSFPSTHATLAWAMAYLLSREEPGLKIWFYLLAIVISLSRIYLGVHYLSDVVAGAFLGWGIGYLAVSVDRNLIGKKTVPHRRHK